MSPNVDTKTVSRFIGHFLSDSKQRLSTVGCAFSVIQPSVTLVNVTTMVRFDQTLNS